MKKLLSTEEANSIISGIEKFYCVKRYKIRTDTELDLWKSTKRFQEYWGKYHFTVEFEDGEDFGQPGKWLMTDFDNTLPINKMTKSEFIDWAYDKIHTDIMNYCPEFEGKTELV